MALYRTLFGMLFVKSLFAIVAVTSRAEDIARRYDTLQQIHNNLINQFEDLIKHLNLHIKTCEIQALGSIQQKMNILAQDNFKIFRTIENLTEVNITKNHKKVDEMIREIMDQYLKEIKFEQKENKNSYVTKQSLQNYKGDLAETFERNATDLLDDTENEMVPSLLYEDTSDESLGFFGDLLKKIDNLTIDDIVIHPSETAANKTTPRRYKKRKLKFWHPPEKTFSSTGNLTRKLFGSFRANVKRHPFMATVHIRNNFVGAGAVIGEQIILTAASCLDYVRLHIKSALKNISVRVGSDYPYRHGETSAVSEVYRHPSYDRTSLQHNIALLRLTKPFRLLKPGIILRKINIATTPDEFRKESEILLVGFGQKRPSNKRKIIAPLSSDRVPVFNLENCQERYSPARVTNDNFCVGVEDKGSGACKNDAGDPGILEGVLVGVVNFGPTQCGTPGAPTVLTHIYPYATWIQRILKKKQKHKVIKKWKSPIKSTTKLSPSILRELREGDTEMENLNSSRKVQYHQTYKVIMDLLEDKLLSNNDFIENLTGAGGKKGLKKTENMSPMRESQEYPRYQESPRDQEYPTDQEYPREQKYPRDQEYPRVQKYSRDHKYVEPRNTNQKFPEEHGFPQMLSLVLRSELPQRPGLPQRKVIDQSPRLLQKQSLTQRPQIPKIPQQPAKDQIPSISQGPGIPPSLRILHRSGTVQLPPKSQRPDISQNPEILEMLVLGRVRTLKRPETPQGP